MKHGCQPGFSLLELLVTLFIVVLVTSLVTLTVTSGGQDIRLESKVRNLADVASYALDEAQLLGRDYGLLLLQDNVNGRPVYSYQWQERLAEGWAAPAADKDVFAAQRLPAEVELQLELEDEPVVDIPPVATDERVSPQVVLYASGETTAGAINVRKRDDGELLWRVEWDLLGRFSVLRRGEAREVPTD